MGSTPTVVVFFLFLSLFAHPWILLLQLQSRFWKTNAAEIFRGSLYPSDKDGCQCHRTKHRKSPPCRRRPYASHLSPPVLLLRRRHAQGRGFVPAMAAEQGRDPHFVCAICRDLTLGKVFVCFKAHTGGGLYNGSAL